jgi:hypothetical protein
MSIAEMGGTDVPYLQDVTTNHTVFHVWGFRGKSRHNEDQSLVGHVNDGLILLETRN